MYIEYWSQLKKRAKKIPGRCSEESFCKGANEFWYYKKVYYSSYDRI